MNEKGEIVLTWTLQRRVLRAERIFRCEVDKQFISIITTGIGSLLGARNGEGG